MALEALRAAKNKMTEFLGWKKGTNIILVGNPGVGNSTLLNGLTGTKHFHAAVSETGAGVTKEISSVKQNGVTWWDGPGLADMDMRAQAAEQIETLLNKGGEYKIFFVATTESGRLRPGDKLTIDEILKSIRSAAEEVHYGVIINKMEETEFANLNNQDHEFKQQLLTMINVDRDEATKGMKLAKSIHMYGLPRQEQLTSGPGATDGQYPVDDELKKFMSTVPSITLSANKAAPISRTNNQQAYQENEMIMKGLAEDINFFKQQAMAQKETINRLFEQQNKRDARYEELAAQLAVAKNRVKEEGVKVPRTEENDGPWGMVGNIAQGLGAPFGLGPVAGAAVKGLKKLFGR